MVDATQERSVNFYRFKSVKELFVVALEESFFSSQQWSAVSELRLRGTRDVFETARAYCADSGFEKRVIGVNVLARLGNEISLSRGAFYAERVSIVLGLAQDKNLHVARAVAYALAQLGGEKCLSVLIGLKDHEDAAIRHAVTVGLVGEDGPEAIAALLALSRDSDEDVRLRATANLSSEAAGNSPQIRDALRQRLDDPVWDIRQEAVWGLAMRKDPECVKMLIDRLGTEGRRQTEDEIAFDKSLDLNHDVLIDALCASLRGILPDDGE